MLQFTLNIVFCDHNHYLPLAQCADRCGWDSIAVADGLFFYEKTEFGYPYTDDGTRFWNGETPFPDPYTVIAAMAAVTDHIKFYANVLKLTVRHPLLVAKQISTVASIFENRIALGVGLSPWPEDFTVLGQEWKERGPRSEEMIDIVRQVMRGGMFEFHGKYYDIPRLQISPVPKNPVPVYIGGLADPVLRRAARMSEGYLGWLNPKCSRADLKIIIEKLRQYRSEYGLEHEPFEIKVAPFDGNMDTIWQLQELGVTDVILTPELHYGVKFDDLPARIDAIKRFSEEVIEPMRAADKN
jgi:alkanesulfonate monooxygenase SsuD/methylene tetrahydromethanopterin reductase-like flavin-dependent oxidoreductase (luciferase family)